MPESWECCHVSDIFELNPKNNVPDDTQSGFIPMACVDDGFGYAHSFETRPWGEIRKGYSHFQNGDIGIAKISPCFENRKSTIFYDLPNGIGAGTTELTVLRGHCVNIEFYLYLFQSEWYIFEGTKEFKGVVGQQRVNKEIFTTLLIPLPPIEEQNRIVTEIKKWFSLIDTLETAKEDLQESIAQAKSKILDLAIHGRLVPQDLNDEPAIELLRRINPKFTPCDNAHYPFNVPVRWSWVRLDNVCEIKGGKRIPRGETFSKEPTEHIYIRVTNMKNNTIIENEVKYITEEVYRQIKNYTISSDDLYLTIAGTIGDVGFVPSRFNGMNLTENAAKLTNIVCYKQYLMIALLSSVAQEHFTSKFHQVAQPKLSIETASSTLIPLPPYNEQQRIVAKIEEIFAVFDEIQKSIEA